MSSPIKQRLASMLDEFQSRGSLSDAICARRQETIAGLLDRPGVFNGISLIAWLKIVERSGVPFVPALIKTQMPVDALLRSDEPHPGDELYAQKFAADLANIPDGHMLRWDCCASERLKVAMHELRFFSGRS